MQRKLIKDGMKRSEKRPQTFMTSLTNKGGGGCNVLTNSFVLLTCFFQPLLDDVKLQVVNVQVCHMDAEGLTNRGLILCIMQFDDAKYTQIYTYIDYVQKLARLLHMQPFSSDFTWKSFSHFMMNKVVTALGV